MLRNLLNPKQKSKPKPTKKTLALKKTILHRFERTTKKEEKKTLANVFFLKKQQYNNYFASKPTRIHGI